MATKIIETDYQRRKRERSEAIVKRYRELMAVEGQLKTPVVELLMQQFNIKSKSTIYWILRNE